MTMTETALVAAQDYVAQLAISPEQAARAYQALRDITRQVLQDGVDYGVIPGTPKPTLYKSGAENLLRFYGLGHRVYKTHSIEDWEKGFFHYEYKVTIHKTFGNGIEHILAECEASCNSREKKYVKQEAVSIVNTIQKMAIKRALVGATLQATGASGLFTQDLDDMDIDPGNQNNGGGSRGGGNGYRGNGNSSGNRAPGAKQQVINKMKEMGMSWDDLASTASAALQRTVKKVMQEIGENEWQTVLDYLNRMNSTSNDLDIDDSKIM